MRHSSCQGPQQPTSEDAVGAFQLLAFLGHAHRWTSDPRWLEAGRRILDRVLALQEDSRFGPEWEGTWTTAGTLSWNQAGRSDPWVRLRPCAACPPFWR
jgi:hypothetical protein